MTTKIEPIPPTHGWTSKGALPCRHPEHDMPHHVHIPPGHRAVHTCPSCGHVTTAENPIVFGPVVEPIRRRPVIDVSLGNDTRWL